MSQLVEPRRRDLQLPLQHRQGQQRHHSDAAGTDAQPAASAGAADAASRGGASHVSASSPPAFPSPSSPSSPQQFAVDGGLPAGRLIQVPSLSSLGSLPHPSPRSPRPRITSPLSAPSNVATSPSITSFHHPIPSNLSSPPPTGRQSAEKLAPEGPSMGEPTCCTASSNHSSLKEEEAPRLRSFNFDFPKAPNDSRIVSAPVPSKPPPSPAASSRSAPSLKSPRLAMAAPMAAALGEASQDLPRNSPVVDIAASTVPSTQASDKSNPQNGQKKTLDIAGLVKAAGSPETVIQHLLKEKQSQSQQNAQLWRLVDKQRAMILGLNKDLEAALKEKEKYRRKLKELMANPAVLQAASAQHSQADSSDRRGTPTAHADVETPPKAQPAMSPDSPGLDSDSQKNSPVDVTMAPYPITPPADGPQDPPSAVDELLDPKHSMPKPQEHAHDKFDHEALEEAADQARKEKSEEQLREIPYNVTLPPSRSLPSEPPKVPPPKPPTAAPPSVAVLGPTPQPDEGLAKFSSPPRKLPPAPLQLKQQVQRNLAPSEDDETESDYDDILQVGETVDEKRGRRRTREEDDREREIIAFREAQERSASKKSKSSKAISSGDEADKAAKDTPLISLTPLARQPSDEDPASLDATLRGANSRELEAPMPAAGLPASPRPLSHGLRLGGTISSLSPRSGGLATPLAPLSPRPPRQAIPLPPNTLPTSPLVTSPSSTSPAQPPSAAKRTGEAQQPGSAKDRSSATERTEIYKGLFTEEHPDLLLPPNALPSIEVKVASSRMKPSRASLLALTQLDEDPVFTLAIISRADRGELWRVEKDIMSLAKLDQRLKHCSAFTAKTPERSLFSGHAPAKLDARRLALDQYMDELLDTPLDTATAVELCRYLSTNTLPPNADETGAGVKATPEKSTHKLGPDGRPTRSGYLTKKGKNFGGWKARFFILDGPLLKYYETPGGTHLGTIKLFNAQIGRQSQNNENASPAQGASYEELDNQYRHAFLILEPKKKDSNSHVKHVLCAENDKERDLWVDVLLQWIDYRGPDDGDAQGSKAAVQDRHASGSDVASGGKTRKGNHQSRQHHQTADPDTLIGVRYDSTQAGETPQGAPGGPKTGGLADHSSPHSFGADTMSSQAKVISGPKDPQVIADSAAWGNRSGLSIPTSDEKKQRKRSFFGFGPKTRSSSDGQDSLFSGSDNGSAATPPQGSYQGPVRQVFGAPLVEAVRYNPPADVNVPLPSVVYRCIQYLDSKNAILEEGIFRLSGSNVVVKQLRERFNTEGDVNLVTDDQYYDIHAVASLLKLYLRELPTTILTRDLHLEFLATTEMKDRKEKVAALSELAQRLPQANATLLKYLISFLIKIINNADVNKMNVRNVGIVFSPTLNIPAPVFAMFLQNYEGVFGIDPEQYELPSPVSEPDSQHRGDSHRVSSHRSDSRRSDSRRRDSNRSDSHRRDSNRSDSHRRDSNRSDWHRADAPRADAPRGRSDGSARIELPARPSTSSGSASPHRQARMEGRREYKRSTPTPPLLASMQLARGSPTPPLAASRQNYEPAYNGPGISSRPAYESVFGPPAGFEGNGHMQAQRATPGYDRPLYPAGSEDHSSGGQSDRPQSTTTKRRESSIYMGGLQHQGSKSRLREEARF